MSGKTKAKALEYLVTYGWAVMAIAIVVFLFWAMGIFNPKDSFEISSPTPTATPISTPTPQSLNGTGICPEGMVVADCTYEQWMQIPCVADAIKNHTNQICAIGCFTCVYSE